MNDDYGTKKTQTLVLIALFAALVATVTLFTSIQYSAGGYFNLGDIVVLLLGAIIPFRQAVIAVSMGSMIADVLAGAVQYAVFTGIIKAGMVFVIYLTRHLLSKKVYFISFVLGSLLMVIGYGIVDSFLLGGYSFYASVSTNAMQAVLGSLFASILYPFTKKLKVYLKG